jgi:hypothetical protein
VADRSCEPSREVEINEAPKWRRAHMQTLQTVLGRAPSRQALLDCIEPVYERPCLSSLVEFNVALIRELVRELGISTPLVMASDLPCEGRGTQLLLDLVRAVGGDVYLSGPSGRRYLEPELFQRARVRLEYHDFRDFDYPQLFGEFVPGLSCFDYIANVGFTPWRSPPG